MPLFHAIGWTVASWALHWYLEKYRLIVQP